MKERPILFSGPMVRAILDGRKTQTRRVIKPQPHAAADAFAWVARGKHSRWTAQKDGKAIGLWFLCPYGGPGDRLWVRETWCEFIDDQGRAVACAADGWAECPAEDDRWRPSIFMPRWASRITLEITGVRVERVQDVSETDAWAEGISIAKEQTWRPLGSKEPYQPYPPQMAFGALWDEINAKRGYSWESNPWVWVVEFKKL